tara:strand:+ start:151 stop:252 length:102 start_codon:yes stop_codon:yes gene_type:complete
MRIGDALAPPLKAFKQPTETTPADFPVRMYYAS